mmetsp:Transcript_14847/g.40852  ORF Transcript_14847/g.40852 Transcript_14847/m.40852 type:complete len:321 (+) Transcript_14847:544-1506(+)
MRWRGESGLAGCGVATLCGDLIHDSDRVGSRLHSVAVDTGSFIPLEARLRHARRFRIWTGPVWRVSLDMYRMILPPPTTTGSRATPTSSQRWHHGCLDLRARFFDHPCWWWMCWLVGPRARCQRIFPSKRLRIVELVLQAPVRRTHQSNQWVLGIKPTHCKVLDDFGRDQARQLLEHRQCSIQLHMKPLGRRTEGAQHPLLRFGGVGRHPQSVVLQKIGHPVPPLFQLIVETGNHVKDVQDLGRFGAVDPHLGTPRPAPHRQQTCSLQHFDLCIYVSGGVFWRVSCRGTQALQCTREVLQQVHLVLHTHGCHAEERERVP